MKGPFSPRAAAPLLVALAVVAFNLVELSPELTIDRADLNDHALHLPLAARMADAIQRGENPLDCWVSTWTLGYAMPRTYQPLGHVAVAVTWLALGKTIALSTIFIWTGYLLLAFFPLIVYASARLMRLTPWTAAACALVAPFVSTDSRYGLEYGSYVWRGSGLYAQLWAMVLLPLALGLGLRALRDGRLLVLAGLALAATFWSHFVYGYIGALSLVVAALLPDEEVPLSRRAWRLLVIGTTAILLTAWLLVPLFKDGQWVNHSRWESQWKWDSLGLPAVLKVLFQGDLLDFPAGAISAATPDRLPILSVLALLGAGTCIVRFRRRGAAAERFALAGSVVWILLFAGRPAWDGLLNLIGLAADVFLHRLVGGAHVFLIFVAGIGLSAAWDWLGASRSAARTAVAVVLTAVVMFPVLLERHRYFELNTEWGQANLASYEAEKADIAAVIQACREREGRVYPGLAAGWGRKLTVGSTPFYVFLSTEQVPAVAFLFHAMALTSDIMVRFDENNPAHYRLFGIRTVVAGPDQHLADFLHPIARYGRFQLYDAPGGAMFDVVDVVAAVPCDKVTFYDVNDPWMAGPWPAMRRYLLLDFGGGSPAGMPRLAPGEALPAVGPEDPGDVVSETRDGEVYSATIDARAPAWVLFKMTYHPNWRAEVDGAPVPTAHLSPGFVGVPVAAGHHAVRFAYRPERSKAALLALVPLALAGGLVLERRRAISRVEDRLAARLPDDPASALARRPRLVSALVLAALVLPVGAPLIQGGLTGGHDHMEYLPRLVEFHESVRHGILLPRWAPDLGSGHGQPLFLFSPPLFNALGEAWHLLGFPFVWALNLAALTLVAGSAAAMYLLASARFGRPGGWLAAAAYLYAPYFCVDLYVRHAMAELSAFPFYPLALHGFLQHARDGRRRHLALGAVGLAGVLCAHHPSALLFLPLVGALIAFNAWRARSPRLLALQGGGAALALLLSAFSWMPGFLEHGQVKVDRLLEGYLRYSNHFVFPWQLVASRWGYGLSVSGDGDTMSFSLGWFHLLLLLVLAVVAYRWPERVPERPLLAGAAVAAGALALFMLPSSHVAWDHLQLLQLVEFPWRLLAVVSACVAFLIGALGGVLAPLVGWRRWAYAAALVGMVAANFMHARPESFEHVQLASWTPSEIARRAVGVTTREEYEPRSVVQPQPWSPERVVGTPGTITVEASTPNRQALRWHSDQAGTVELRTYFFPGWAATLDGHDAPIDVQPTGLMRVAVPAGDHAIVLRLRHTGVETLSLLLSLAGLVVVVGLLVERRANGPRRPDRA